jgi:16S rRNA (guanine966-N2)-methyltransferase
MRIIAGLAKGRTLKTLRSRELRPTMDRVREALFAVLSTRVVEARFLDLYAGAGTVGLEALSRGAAEAWFVEAHRPAGQVIRENAERCGFADQAKVIVAPVPRGLAQLRQQGSQFDLIFADPPYDREEAKAVMARLAQWPQVLAEGGVLVLQRSRHEEVGEQVGVFRRMKQAKFGETMLDYFQVGGEAA